MKNLITIIVSVLGIALTGYIVCQSLTTELFPWPNVFIASVAVVCQFLLLAGIYSAKDSLQKPAECTSKIMQEELKTKLEDIEKVLSTERKQEELNELNKQIEAAKQLLQQQIDFKNAAKRIIDIAEKSDTLRKTNEYLKLIDAFVKLKYPDYISVPLKSGS